MSPPSDVRASRESSTTEETSTPDDQGLDPSLYPNAVIIAQDLRVQLSGEVLFERVSFVVDQGEIAIIIGPNGAGKTMLIKTLLGLLPLQTGAIRIFGRDPRELGKHRDRIGYMPQRLYFDRTFPITVCEVLLLRMKKAGFWIRGAEAREHIAATLERVRGEKLIDRRIGQLSGGELQRILLAYALLPGPDLLLLDEPVAGVDVAGEETFYELIHNLKQEEDLTVIMVSHDLDVVYRYADQVLCLNRELLCRGAPRAVLGQQILEATYGRFAGSYHHDHH